MSTEETRAEADVKITSGSSIEDDDERVMTIKLDLRGPAEFVSWMRDMSPVPVGIPRLSSLLPEGAREHMMNAQREQLLAVRSVVDSMLDAMINRLERTGEKPARKTRKVDVE